MLWYVGEHFETYLKKKNQTGSMKERLLLGKGVVLISIL